MDINVVYRIVGIIWVFLLREVINFEDFFKCVNVLYQNKKVIFFMYCIFDIMIIDVILVVL